MFICPEESQVFRKNPPPRTSFGQVTLVTEHRMLLLQPRFELSHVSQPIQACDFRPQRYRSSRFVYIEVLRSREHCGGHTTVGTLGITPLIDRTDIVCNGNGCHTNNHRHSHGLNQ